jgi:glucose dehydrogenase
MPLGFFTASGLVMLIMPLMLGFRQPIYLVLMALIFMALVWVVFSIVLEKPLPPEFWSSARRGG